MWRSAEDGSPAHVVTNECTPVDIAGCVRPLRRFGAPAPPSAPTLVSGRLASPLPTRTRLHLIVWTPVALAPYSSNNRTSPTRIVDLQCGGLGGGHAVQVPW